MPLSVVSTTWPLLLGMGVLMLGAGLQSTLLWGEPVETVVHGPIQDQAALQGLLVRLETFGVQVVEVRRLHDRDPSADDRDHP